MKNSDYYTPVRFSHLTGYAGVGSIVRGSNDFLMVVSDTRYWTDKKGAKVTEPLKFVDRVKKHLKITKDLRMPPEAQVGKDKIDGHPLPAVIFPSYSVCKSCHRLHYKPWNGLDKNISKDLLCSNCKKPRLEQVTWCLVSDEGGLKDVDWHDACHGKSQNGCKRDYGADYLELVTGERGKDRVRCTRCGESNVFSGSDEWCSNNQPWIKWSKGDTDDVRYKIKEINNPHVYTAVKGKAIVIPPESNIDKDSILYKISCDSIFLRNIKDESHGLKRKKIFISAAHRYRCTVDEIKDALSKMESDQSLLDGITPGEMYKDEYEALITNVEFKDGADFVTKHKTQEWHDYLKKVSVEDDLKRIFNIVDNTVAVNRLRVIEVFKGFSRTKGEPDTISNIVPPDVMNEQDWLPAIELFGEGIFLTINQEILNIWENLHEVRLRADEINKRYEESSVGQFDNLSTISPRFILLHTLSHLIIRELEVSAGYPAASLKERIYSSQGNDMAGILIYTAVPDISGSLGGIVEMIKPENFLKLLDGVFKHAQWCSLDPVCTEHEGQGPEWLNRAACHACSLVPETSCEYGNVFLDRVFIKGSDDSNIPPILSIESKS